MNECLRDVLRRQLLEATACPVRGQLYGGMPGGGDYRANTEFEIGAVEIAEAAHCILGSLGKRAGGRGWDDVYRIEQGHIDEENGIIQKTMREYSRQVYTDMLANPLKGVRPERQKERMEYVEASVKSIRSNSPKLASRAKKMLAAWMQQTDVPEDLHRIGVNAYQVIIDLAEAMVDSVKGYPERVTNPYRDSKLRATVALLDGSVKRFDKIANEKVPQSRAPKAEPAPTAPGKPPRDKKPGESDIDYTMYLLGMSL